MHDILFFLQEHWTLSLVLCAVLIVLVVLELIKQKTGSAALTPHQATQHINHDNAVVVDVRSTEAYANGHIIDAISLPLADLESSLKKLEKYKSQPLIVVCAMGAESQRAAALLQKNGFNVSVLGGGLRSWSTEQLPLVKK